MPLVAYNPNIPLSTNNPSQDQPNLFTNTNAVNTLLAVDHYPFNDPNGGLHKQVIMPLRGGPPGTIPPTLTIQEGALYTKTVTSTSPTPSLTETGLFYTPDASGNEYQLTRTITASFASFAQNAPYGTPPAGFTQNGGWTFLPGGMLMQYGFYGKVGALTASGTIQFPVKFINNPYSVTAILVRASSANQFMSLPGTVSTTSFNFQASSGSSDGVYWMAIGV